MLIPNHPDDERLSALASGEADATADDKLTAHVSSCDRCTGLVSELGALRAALADLPDLAPSRPLQLLPPVEAASVGAADRLGGWARRFFAPVLASGAALALVGVIGTTAPALPGGQAGAAPASEGVNALQLPTGEPAPSAATDRAAGTASSTAPEGVAASAEPAAAVPGAEESPASRDGEDSASPLYSDSGAEAEGELSDGSISAFDDGDQAASDPVSVERSPWPMVLFTGVALMIGALLLRWILVPRAG